MAVIETRGLTLDKLIAITDVLEPEVRLVVGRTGLRAAAGIVLRAARKKAPVGKGRISRKRAINILAGHKRSRALKDTGYAKSVKPKAQYDNFAAVAGFSAPHSWLVEHGHGGPRGPARPHPYLAPAIRETEQRCVGAIERALSRAMPEIRTAAQAAANRVRQGKQYRGRRAANRRKAGLPA